LAGFCVESVGVDQFGNFLYGVYASDEVARFRRFAKGTSFGFRLASNIGMGGASHSHDAHRLPETQDSSK
jgi:hypothetical protein